MSALEIGRPLPSSGELLWKDLQDWFADANGIDDPMNLTPGQELLIPPLY